MLFAKKEFKPLLAAKLSANGEEKRKISNASVEKEAAITAASEDKSRSEHWEANARKV